MVAFRVGDDMHKVFEVGKRAEGLINSRLKPPMELELENVYFPFMMFAKKVYCAVKWTRPEEPDGVIYKGLKVVRRDTCELVRRVSKSVVHQLLIEKDGEEAVRVVRRAIKELLRGQVDLRDIVLSQTLKPIEDYKVTKLPHLHVVGLMESRMTGSAPKSGESPLWVRTSFSVHQAAVLSYIESRGTFSYADAGNRVEYVYIEQSDPSVANSARVDDPAYVTENAVPVDYAYTLRHAFLNPVCMLLDPLLGRDDPRHERYVEKTRNDRRLQDVIRQVLDDDAITGLLKDTDMRTADRERTFVNAKNRQKTILSFCRRG